MRDGQGQSGRAWGAGGTELVKPAALASAPGNPRRLRLSPLPAHPGADTLRCVCRPRGRPLPARRPQGLSWPSGPAPGPERRRSAWCLGPGPSWRELASPCRTGRAAPWSPAVPTGTAPAPRLLFPGSVHGEQQEMGCGGGGRGGKGGPQGLPDHRPRRHRGNGQRGPRALHLKGLRCPAPGQVPAAGESWGTEPRADGSVCDRRGKEGPGLQTHRSPAVPGPALPPAPVADGPDTPVWPSELHPLDDPGQESPGRAARQPQGWARA